MPAKDMKLICMLGKSDLGVEVSGCSHNTYARLVLCMERESIGIPVNHAIWNSPRNERIGEMAALIEKFMSRTKGHYYLLHVAEHP